MAEIGAENRRTLAQIRAERFDNEGHSTASSEEQEQVERSVLTQYDIYDKRAEVDEECPVLLRQKHISFLKKSLTHLPGGFQCLDSSRPWLVYWNVHALALLEESLMSEDYSSLAGFLAKCQSPNGGFGGGPGQMPHLACTYAAVNALCTIGTKEAFNVINREKLQQFFWSVRQPDGSFIMHQNGEVDVRGAYCALSVAKLTNIYTPSLFEGTAEWIVRCQSYEGGFSACPGMEAHGGYSFCGLATLFMLGKDHLCDINAFTRWIVNRQMRLEGGFQGRTNKLVDACYSFWQGGAFLFLHNILFRENKTVVSADKWLFNQEALQEYVLMCCQLASGGLIDKPGKPRDAYHTCYALSGLSIAQHTSLVKKCVLGSKSNLLAPIHPMYNITVDSAVKSMKYFENLAVPQIS
ncbi:protein farnesyltransferase subunit beta [Thrips palmi]|uniref:Protein farnesyltransferase subunit beta n=1 Tax=Thrips palmi TaxID=161013 RepID=A0A6P9A0D5_THRPL|nr:protein farnesyltransferase subunit beta [Thrips palmi]